MATASVPNTFVNETAADADEVNQNFASIINFINQNVVHRDASKAMQGALDAGSNKIVNVTAPTAATDAANKAYVDAIEIATANIDDLAVTTAKLAADAVTTAKIAADAITSAELADNSVNSEHYVDGSIDNVHLANDSVNGSKIADNSINSEHYVDGSIDAVHLASSSVTEAKIASGAVTAGKIDDQVTDDAGPTSDLGISTSFQTVCSETVSCASGSVAIISGFVDVRCDTGSSATVIVELVVNGTAQKGQALWRPVDNNLRQTVGRVWVVSMPTMSSDTIQLRVRKDAATGAVYAVGAADSSNHSRLQCYIIEA